MLRDRGETALAPYDLRESAVGADARTRRIGLSARAREVMPFLVAEWRATEAAVRELDAELPYALSRVTADLRALLDARPFPDRLRDHLG